MDFNAHLNNLEIIIRISLQNHFESEKRETYPEIALPPAEDDVLSQLLSSHKLTVGEYTCILLALAPHLSPNFIMRILQDFLPDGGDFPEFGAVKGKNHRGILPTGETVLFVLAGENHALRAKCLKMFASEHPFSQHQILHLEEVPLGEPAMSGKLIMNQEYIELFTTGNIAKPQLSSSFPAQLIETALNWGDLVLSPKTMNQVCEIETWLKHNHTLLHQWQMNDRIKPGFRVLFAGPSGTGKTLTASLLGKFTERDVYRIDLSMVVSKYIGETEKNLSQLFNRAKSKNWILFFDEADAIFGKRTSVRDAHDKYANQEVSYLLQRIESHEGLVILASNFKNNIDTAFTRRFNAIVEFEKPAHNERLMLWQKNLPSQASLDEKIDIDEISMRFELSGANIVNVIHYACLKTLEKDSATIRYEDLMQGIQKEYTKEGKMVNIIQQA